MGCCLGAVGVGFPSPVTKQRGYFQGVAPEWARRALVQPSVSEPVFVASNLCQRVWPVALLPQVWPRALELPVLHRVLVRPVFARMSLVPVPVFSAPGVSLARQVSLLLPALPYCRRLRVSSPLQLRTPPSPFGRLAVQRLMTATLQIRPIPRALQGHLYFRCPDLPRSRVRVGLPHFSCLRFTPQTGENHAYFSDLIVSRS